MAHMRNSSTRNSPFHFNFHRHPRDLIVPDYRHLDHSIHHNSKAPAKPSLAGRSRASRLYMPVFIETPTYIHGNQYLTTETGGTMQPCASNCNLRSSFSILLHLEVCLGFRGFGFQGPISPSHPLVAFQK